MDNGGKILAHEGSEEQVETISHQGRGSARWHVREGKWPEMRGELPFKIKQEVRRQETKPHCEVTLSCSAENLCYLPYKNFFFNLSVSRLIVFDCFQSAMTATLA